MDCFQNKAYINGEWVSAYDGKTFPVYNPATGLCLDEVPDMGEAETRFAIDSAQKALKSWKNSSASERSHLLKRWHQLLLEHKNELARVLTSEQGKPLAEAIAEVKYGLSYIEWFAEEARRIYGDIIPGQDTSKRIMVLKEAVGVVGLITPWNFPNAMIARKIGAALAAGCTVVVKPAEETPFSTLAMAYLAELAGFPKGVINVVTSNQPEVVGAVLCNHSDVKKISFTGSTAVGKLLMQQSAGSVKRLSLELGGNAPFIVFEDADIDSAIKGLMQSKYRNAGQTCVCANRILVQNSIHDDFVNRLSEETAKLKIGNGFDEGVDIGPLINENALQKMETLVADAILQGAVCKIGGKKMNPRQLYYEPTVLTGVTENMRICQEEIFGPISAISTFQNEAEAIQMANNTSSGLAAYFYGRDINRIYRVMEALEFGMVGVNTGLLSTVTAPFGGIKESGFGREGSSYGIEEYLNMKYICIGDIK